MRKIHWSRVAHGVFCVNVVIFCGRGKVVFPTPWSASMKNLPISTLKWEELSARPEGGTHEWLGDLGRQLKFVGFALVQWWVLSLESCLSVACGSVWRQCWLLRLEAQDVLLAAVGQAGDAADTLQCPGFPVSLVLRIRHPAPASWESRRWGLITLVSFPCKTNLASKTDFHMELKDKAGQERGRLVPCVPGDPPG